MYDIKPPKNDKEGLQNFVMLISNSIKEGNTREALLKADDLIDSLNSCSFSWIDPNYTPKDSGQEYQEEPAQVTQIIPANKINLDIAYYRNSYWI